MPPTTPVRASTGSRSIATRASYVASTLVVPDSTHTRGTVTSAKVTLDIALTYKKSDLRVELVAPSGASVRLHDRTGGGDNNIKGVFTASFPGGTIGAGTWRLVVSDHAGLDTGTLTAWSIELGAGADRTVTAATDTPVFIPDAPKSAGEAGVASIAISPPAIDTWVGRLGRVVASEAHAASRGSRSMSRPLAACAAEARAGRVRDRRAVLRRR